MTGNTTPTTKLQALTLALAMVLSVVAGTAMLSGTVAATSVSANGPTNVTQGANTEPVGTLEIDEDSNSEWGSSGTATITAKGDHTFNTSDTSISYSTSGSISNIQVSADEITFDYSNMDTGSIDNIDIDGVETDVATDASSVSVRVKIGTASATTLSLNLETPALTFNNDGNVDVSAGGSASSAFPVKVHDNATAEEGPAGLIENGSTVMISIPDDRDVSFDTSVSLSSPSTSGQMVVSNERYMDSGKTVAVDVDESDGAYSSDDSFTVSGLQVEAESTAAATSSPIRLELTTTPPNASGEVTTNGNQNNGINVNAPSLDTSDNSDLDLENDRDGEFNISDGATDDIIIQSGANGDIVDTNAGTNITITIPSDAAFTFNTYLADDDDLGPSEDLISLGTNGGLATPGTFEAELVDERTINVTLDGATADGTDDEVVLQGIEYNTTAGEAADSKLQFEVNKTLVSGSSQSFTNVTLQEPDQIRADADDSGTLGTEGSGEENDSATIGSTVTGEVELQNTTYTGDNDFDALGGEDISLSVNSTASLNTTTVTTGPDGQARFNVTLGSQVGIYEVTAESDSQNDINMSLYYDATADSAGQVNVTQVDNALRNTGTVNEEHEAAYKVRVEDSDGNLNSNTDLDINVVVGGDATLVEVADGIDSNGDDLNAFTNTDGDNDGRINYDASNDNDGDAGVFYVFVSDQTAEDVEVTVDPESGDISSDSATSTFFGTVSQVDVSFNTSDTVDPGQVVNATATAQTSDGTTIEVPRLSTTFDTSNSTVATVSGSSPVDTDDDGTATTQYTAEDVDGTADLQAFIKNKQGARTLTVDQPEFAIQPGTVDPSTVTENTTVTHTIEYTVTGASNDGNSDDYEVTLPASASFASANSVNVTDANGDSIQVSSSPSLTGVNGGTDNQLEFGIQPDSSFDTSEITVNISADVEFPSVSSETTVGIDANVTDSSKGDAGPTEIATVTIEEATSASVTFDDKTVAGTSGTTVTVESATLSEGGFVVLHNQTELQNGQVVGSIVGNSSALSAGTSTDVNVTLTEDISNGTYVAMPHFDSNDNGVYDFPQDQNLDTPYTDANGDAIVDPAVLNVTDDTGGAVPPVIGNNNPTDTNGDGKLDDIDGNGELEIFDVQALFNNLGTDVIDNNAAKFNFDDQGGVNIFDVQSLFNSLP
jgi:hypothetical protein